jgi:hypothetical protein
VYGRTQRSIRNLLTALHPVHPNLLIVGSDADAACALPEIRPILRVPVVSWSPRDTARLPAIWFRTLMVRDVDWLTTTQQGMLSTLVTKSVHTIQIVSMARRPVFPLVREGRFLEALYYRLNVVLLELSSGTDQYRL